MPVVDVPVSLIVDSDTFHDVFAAALGFPPFYGRNIDAWIDCLTYRDKDDGMASVVVPSGDVLTLQLDDGRAFAHRCPEKYAALIECAAFVKLASHRNGRPTYPRVVVPLAASAALRQTRHSSLVGHQFRLSR